MKITSIESFVLKDTLQESFYFSQWEYAERNICIVKITSDSGHVGWGEGYGPAQVVKAGIDQLSTYVIGQSPMDSEKIWNTMYRKTMDFSRSGVLVSAISAIDVAIWDLKGKILELPVYTLLGGKKRETIMPYATGMYFSDKGSLPELLSTEAKTYVEQGFKAMKMKVGLGVDVDVENVSAVREAIGPEIKLMIDANHAYNFKEALALSSAVERYNIDWFEEPVSPEYYEQYAALRSRTNIPIAGGECEYLRYGFQRLLKANGVDIAQPDICACGGLTEAKKISVLTSVYGIPIVPHTWGTGIALSAAAHFILNLDEIPGRLRSPHFLMEYDRTENRLREELTSNYIEFSNGMMTIPDRPGLGFDVNENILQKYAVT